MDKKWPAWIVLGLIALIAGCALGLTNEVTAPVIKEQALASADEARRAVLPAATDFEGQLGRWITTTSTIATRDLQTEKP